MTTASTVVAFEHPEHLDDPLTSVLRAGARRLLAQAVEAEAEAFLASMKDERLADGRARIVRHGHGPEREIQTGIGPVPVKRAKLRDRGVGEADAQRITVTSALLPKWVLRTKSFEALLPILYLRGLSAGDFREALAALLGKAAANLSPSVIGRLEQQWEGEHECWQQRDLSARRYVYIWEHLGRRGLPAGPDGGRGRVHARRHRRHAGGAQGAGRLPGRHPREHAELAEAARRPEGARALSRRPGWRSATAPWASGRRSTRSSPRPATRDASRACWPCPFQGSDDWPPGQSLVRKIANVLHKVPKSVQPGMKEDLREVRDAPDRATAEAEAEAAIGTFAEKYATKYPKAVECLAKDREALLAFFDFRADPLRRSPGLRCSANRIKVLLALDGIICARRTRSRACSPPSGTGQSVPKAARRGRRRTSWSSSL